MIQSDLLRISPEELIQPAKCDEQDKHGQRGLTGREQEILSWIAQGKSDASIGQILNISSKTVNYHVENAKRKFSVATRIQAVIAAMRQNMLKG
jgi:DNA-binding CsgD family transcriptional regulator